MKMLPRKKCLVPLMMSIMMIVVKDTNEVPKDPTQTSQKPLHYAFTIPLKNG